MLVCLNFTPVARDHYRVGVPTAGAWHEIFNSDAFGGSGRGNPVPVMATSFRWNGWPQSIVVTIPPLGAVFLKGAT